MNRTDGRDFYVVSALFVVAAGLAMLFGLLWYHDQKTDYVYLPMSVHEYYRVDVPYRVEVPVVLPCPRESMKQLKPWNEERLKKQMAEG